MEGQRSRDEGRKDIREGRGRQAARARRRTMEDRDGGTTKQG